MRRYVNWLCEQNIPVILLTYGSSEFCSLTDEEIWQLTAELGAEISGRLVVHLPQRVGGTPGQCRQFLKHCNSVRVLACYQNTDPSRFRRKARGHCWLFRQHSGCRVDSFAGLGSMARPVSRGHRCRVSKTTGSRRYQKTTVIRFTPTMTSFAQLPMRISQSLAGDRCVISCSATQSAQRRISVPSLLFDQTLRWNSIML